MHFKSANSQSKPKRPHWVRGSARRMGGALCLLAWLVAASGFLPALAVALAQIDPQHRVLIEHSENGLRLVLRHDQARCHHLHHLPARVLMAIAAPQSDPGADHVLNFGGGGAQDDVAASTTVPEPHQDEAPAPVEKPALILETPEVIRLAVARPPPDSPPAAVVVARSTTRQI